MKFDFETAGFDRNWHGGNALITCFWNAMSSMFPPGERFFIDAVASVRPLVDDPDVRVELAEFVRQEGHHSLHHQRFNRLLRDQGFDMQRYEKRTAVPLELAARTLLPMQKLAVTVALEHFTAVAARVILANPRFMEGADPNVRALWMWHAMEELEHKSTCFDLHERLGGRHRSRVRAMRAAWSMELVIVFRNVMDMLWEQGHLLDVRDHAKGLWYLFGPRGFLTSMVPGLLEYCRPDFHPWSTDDTHFIADWKAMNHQHVRNARDVAPVVQGCIQPAAEASPPRKGEDAAPP